MANQGREGGKVQGGEGVGGPRLDQDSHIARQCLELCEDHPGGGISQACSGGDLEEDGFDGEEDGGDEEEGGADGGEDAQCGRLQRPSPPEVSERQVVHHFKEGAQRHQKREGAGGAGHVCGEACDGPDRHEVGGQSGEGGHQVMPPHQDWVDRPPLGLQARLSLRPGRQRHQGWKGAPADGRVHQLRPDQPPCLSPLRGASTGEEQEGGEVLCGQRRLHLCPAMWGWCCQGEADVCERRGCLGGGRRSWRPQPQPLDCHSKRGEGSVCKDQLEDTKKLTAIVIPKLVPETWYSLSSLSSEFGKMLVPCMPLNSKTQIIQNVVAKLKVKGSGSNFELFSFNQMSHDDDVDQAYKLRMLMGAKYNV